MNKKIVTREPPKLISEALKRKRSTTTTDACNGREEKIQKTELLSKMFDLANMLIVACGRNEYENVSRPLHSLKNLLFSFRANAWSLDMPKS